MVNLVVLRRMQGEDSSDSYIRGIYLHNNLETWVRHPQNRWRGESGPETVEGSLSLWGPGEFEVRVCKGATTWL